MLNKIRSQAEQHPNRIAYKVNEAFITYGELWKNAIFYAELLKKQGTAPVIIYGHKEIEVIVSILACIIANRTYIPIDLHTPFFRLKKIADVTQASLLITNEALSLEAITCCKLTELKKFERACTKTADHEFIYTIFTSGSTGEPKGVPISKTNLNNFVNWISALKPLCDYHEINVLNQACFSFDLSVADLYYTLCNGHTLIALDRIDDYDSVFKTIRQNKIGLAVVTPTFIKLCLLNRDFNEHHYPDLQCIYFCGEQLEVKTAKQLFERFHHIKIINAYGPTEATSAVSAIVITKDMTNQKILPVGETNAFATDIEIVDGEIILKGASVFNGYLGGQVGGHYKENNVNCYKTGDLGNIIDSKLYCKGRKDSQVKFKGYRIELTDIEYHLSLISGIHECAVVPKYTEDRIVKSLKAFIVADKGIESSDVKKELLQLLPSYMVPKSIQIIDRMPTNSNGKTDRKALMSL